MTLPGRQILNCQPELMLTDHKLNFLRYYALSSQLHSPDPLVTPSNLSHTSSNIADERAIPSP